MRSMFVMRRPGILVVSGTIADTTDDGIVLENSFLYPVSGKEEKTRCFLECKPDTVKKMRLAKGASIIASATDDFLVEMLMEGAEPSTREYHLKGYTIRYNGSFDFEAHRDQKEQHVISGTILSAVSGTRQDYTWSRLTIGWRKNGKDEKRNIVYWSREGVSFAGKCGKRIIAVTGEARTSNQITYYLASEVYDF